MNFLIYSNIFFFILATVMTLMFCRYRKRLYYAKNKIKNPIIKVLSFEQCFPTIVTSAIKDIKESEIYFVGNVGLGGATSDTESWILSILAKQAKTMFEFGTASGRTAYLWAKNSCNNACIITLSLHPNQANEYTAEIDDNPFAKIAAINESTYTKFVYSGTDVEGKITQLYCDSKLFDESMYLNKFDLIFIDGSHAYSYVKNDTEKALRMVKKNGGIIVWHDYLFNSQKLQGVYKYLNEISNNMPLTHIRDTSLVVYKSSTKNQSGF